MFKNETLIQHDSNVYQDVMLSSNGSILFYQIYNIKENVLHFQYYFWDGSRFITVIFYEYYCTYYKPKYRHSLNNYLAHD